VSRPLSAMQLSAISTIHLSARVRKAGTCTTSSSSKVELLSNQDGNLEVNFVVDMNILYRSWLVTIRWVGRQVYSATIPPRAAAAAAASSTTTTEVCTAAALYV
jgi:hypothetical protein